LQGPLWLNNEETRCKETPTWACACMHTHNEKERASIICPANTVDNRE